MSIHETLKLIPSEYWLDYHTPRFASGIRNPGLWNLESGFWNPEYGLLWNTEATIGVIQNHDSARKSI